MSGGSTIPFLTTATGAAEAGGRPRPQRLPLLFIEDDLYGVLYFET
jgi:hypothetical protein